MGVVSGEDGINLFFCLSFYTFIRRCNYMMLLWYQGLRGMLGVIRYVLAVVFLAGSAPNYFLLWAFWRGISLVLPQWMYVLQISVQRMPIDGLWLLFADISWGMTSSTPCTSGWLSFSLSTAPMSRYCDNVWWLFTDLTFPCTGLHHWRYS